MQGILFKKIHHSQNTKNSSETCSQPLCSLLGIPTRKSIKPLPSSFKQWSHSLYWIRLWLSFNQKVLSHTPYMMGSFVKNQKPKPLKRFSIKNRKELYGLAPSLHCDYIDIPQEEDEIDDNTTSADDMIDAINSWQMEQDMLEGELEW